MPFVMIEDQSKNLKLLKVAKSQKSGSAVIKQGLDICQSIRDVLCRQPIKLVQVVSISEFHEY